MKNRYLIPVFFFLPILLFGQTKNCNVIYSSGIYCYLTPIKKYNDTIISKLPQHNCNNYYFDTTANGYWKIYSEDMSELIEIVNIYKGKRNGIEIIYFNNGDIKSKANYENNVLKGEYISFIESGKIKKYGHYYQNEKFIGIDIEYWDNGNIALQRIVNNDFYYGKDTKYWDNKGNIIDYNTYSKLWHDCH